MSLGFRHFFHSNEASPRICLVTGFPPTAIRLSEYGYHLARAVRQNGIGDLVVLADKNDHNGEIPIDVRIDRCWRMSSLTLPFVIAGRALRHRARVVWFNLGFSSFADKPLPAFIALLSPAFLRLLGFHVQVTLHTFMDNVDLTDAGVKHPRLYRFFGAVATRCLLRAHEVAVLLPSYRNLLIHKYGASPERVRCHPHGTFHPHHFPIAPDANQHVLAFGSWGTYKRLETLLSAFPRIAASSPGTKLVVAGRSHPKTPGYLEALMMQHAGASWLDYRGYVPEEQLPMLFASAAIAVLPYDSSAGSSGVAHQACAFGVPIVATDTPDFREMANEENLMVEFVSGNEVEALASAISSLLEDEDRRRHIASHNQSASQRFTMTAIVKEYLCRFQQRLAVPNLASGPQVEARL